MLSLAYENSHNLTKPISYPYPAVTLNIIGADASTPYYRQFASYALYHTLQTMGADNDFTVSNFALQNQVGAIAYKVVHVPPRAEWQQLIGGSSGGPSPRSTDNTPLPATLVARQASRLHS